MMTPQAEAEARALNFKLRILRDQVATQMAFCDEANHGTLHGQKLPASEYVPLCLNALSKAKAHQVEINSIIEYMRSALDAPPSLTDGFYQRVEFTSGRGAQVPGGVVVPPSQPEPPEVPVPPEQWRWTKNGAEEVIDQEPEDKPKPVRKKKPRASKAKGLDLT